MTYSRNYSWNYYSPPPGRLPYKPGSKILPASSYSKVLENGGNILIIVLFLTVMFFTETSAVSYAGDKYSGEKFSGDKMSIVVTIEPLAQFVEKIGGEMVEVEVLIPRGADPHTFEPKPRQLKKLAEAQLLIKVGSGLEFENVWIEKLLKSNKDLKVVNSSAGITLIAMSNSMDRSLHKNNRNSRHGNRGHGKNDPHIWLSPVNAIKMVENIYEGIAKADRANQPFYKTNKNRYIKELLALDGFIRDAVSAANIKRFMAYHPAWGYYANEYGLEQISVEVEGKEPSIKSIRNAVETAGKHNIRVIFTSPELSTTGPELIAREINGKTVLISPLEKEYIPNLYKFTEILTGVSKD